MPWMTEGVVCRFIPREIFATYNPWHGVIIVNIVIIDMIITRVNRQAIIIIIKIVIRIGRPWSFFAILYQAGHRPGQLAPRRPAATSRPNIIQVCTMMMTMIAMIYI